MTTAIVSPGYMGAGLGGALKAGGERVVATVEGRSARTRRLAEEAGLELLPGLTEVVATAEVVLVVTPPGDAVAAAEAIRVAARKTGAGPLVADRLVVVGPRELIGRRLLARWRRRTSPGRGTRPRRPS